MDYYQISEIFTSGQSRDDQSKQINLPLIISQSKQKITLPAGIGNRKPESYFYEKLQQLVSQVFKANGNKLNSRAQSEMIKIRIFSTLAGSMINQFSQKPFKDGLFKAMIKSIDERQIKERIKFLMQHQIETKKPFSISKSVQRPQSSQSNHINPIQTPSQHETSISFLNNLAGETGKMSLESDQKKGNYSNLLQTSQDYEQFFNSNSQRHQSIERFNTAHFRDSIQQSNSKQLVRNAKYMMAIAQQQQRKQQQQQQISYIDGGVTDRDYNSSCLTSSYRKQDTVSSQGTKSIKVIPIRATRDQDDYTEDDDDNDMRVLSSGINYEQDSELNMYPSTIMEEVTRQDAFTSGCRTNGYNTKQLYQTKKQDMAVVEESKILQQEEQKINDSTNQQQILITQAITPQVDMKQVAYHHLSRPSSQLQLALSPDHNRCLQNLGKLPNDQNTKTSSSASIPLSHRRNQSSNSSYLLSNTGNNNMMNENINSNASSSCYFLPPVGSSQASSLYSSIVSSNYQTLRQDSCTLEQESTNKMKEKKPQLLYLNPADGTPAFGRKSKSIVSQIGSNALSAKTNILASGRYDNLQQQAEQNQNDKSQAKILILHQCQKLPVQKINAGLSSTSSSSSVFNPSEIISNRHKNFVSAQESNGRNTHLDLTQLSSISNTGSIASQLPSQNILSTSSRGGAAGGAGNSNKNISNKNILINSARASSMSLDYNINSSVGIKKYGGNLLRKDHRNNRSTANIRVTDMSNCSSFSYDRGTTAHSAINSSRSTTRQNSCDQVIRYSVIDELDKAKRRFGNVSASFSLDDGNRSMWARPRANITASENRDTKKRGVCNKNSQVTNALDKFKMQKGGAQQIVELSTKMAADANQNLEEIKPVQSIFGKIRDQNRQCISTRAQRINSMQDLKENENQKVKIMKTDIKFQSKAAFQQTISENTFGEKEN